MVLGSLIWWCSEITLSAEEARWGAGELTQVSCVQGRRLPSALPLGPEVRGTLSIPSDPVCDNSGLGNPSSSPLFIYLFFGSGCAQGLLLAHPGMIPGGAWSTTCDVGEKPGRLRTGKYLPTVPWLTPRKSLLNRDQTGPGAAQSAENLFPQRHPKGCLVIFESSLP